MWIQLQSILTYYRTTVTSTTVCKTASLNTKVNYLAYYNSKQIHYTDLPVLEELLQLTRIACVLLKYRHVSAA